MQDNIHVADPSDTSPGPEQETTASATGDTMARLNQALGGRYVVAREIGRGGMATVYLASDVRHGRPVAVKVFVPAVTSAITPGRFLREIEVVARLNHPHILPLHDSGQAGDLLYYVMPYVRGQSLRQLLDARTRLRVDEALQITREIASALDHAHGQGLVHRDIKPQNILLHEGEAMLMDFGIAHVARDVPEEALTQPGLVVGTPAYMSPEQAIGEPGLDARSDVYALASVLYEMLTGELPFKGPTFAALVNQRLVGTAPSLQLFRIDVPPAVTQAVDKALSRAATDRFASAGAFAAALSGPAGVPAGRSVAVLPFVNLSPEPENEYFADGMTEDVIAHLSKMPSLKVISRTSVMAFKKRDQDLRDIATRLNAGVLLDGSVRRAGDRVRIVAQLVDARTNQHLWAETYDRRLTDIFEIQTDVALQIARALDAALSPDEQRRIRREPTSNIEAYQQYLQGRHWLVRYTAEGMRKGITYFERAIECDPDYALAYTGIAYAHLEMALIGLETSDTPYAPARKAVEKALALDSGLVDAHCMLAQIKSVADFDWSGAEAEFKRALELGPSHADTYDLYGRMCAAVGRFDEAIAMGERAHELDPLAHRSDLATTLLRAGRHKEALEAALKGVEFDPHYDRGHATLGWALFLNGRQDEGIAALQRAVATSGGGPAWLSQLGQAYGMAGRTEEARGILAQLLAAGGQRYVSPYHLAYVYVGLGEYEAAMDMLEQAFEQRSGAISGIKGSFLFTPLRTHPRFNALLAKMRLQ
jgi:serine/threonine protein kinase/tetratricopeptide (TPR) repeat protein